MCILSISSFTLINRIIFASIISGKDRGTLKLHIKDDSLDNGGVIVYAAHIFWPNPLSEMISISIGDFDIAEGHQTCALPQDLSRIIRLLYMFRLAI